MFDQIPEDIIANHIVRELEIIDYCALSATCKTALQILGKYPLYVKLSYKISAEKDSNRYDVLCIKWFDKHIDKCDKFAILGNIRIIEYLYPIRLYKTSRPMHFLGKYKEIVEAAKINPAILQSTDLSQYAAEYTRIIVSKTIKQSDDNFIVAAAIYAMDSEDLLSRAYAQWKRFYGYFIEFIAEIWAHSYPQQFTTSFFIRNALFDQKLDIIKKTPEPRRVDFYKVIMDRSFIRDFIHHFAFHSIGEDVIMLLADNLRQIPREWTIAIVLKWREHIRTYMWKMSCDLNTHILLLECIFDTGLPLPQDKFEQIAAKCNIKPQKLYYDMLNISLTCESYWWRKCCSVLSDIDCSGLTLIQKTDGVRLEADSKSDAYDAISLPYKLEDAHVKLLKLLPKAIKFGAHRNP